MHHLYEKPNIVDDPLEKANILLVDNDEESKIFMKSILLDNKSYSVMEASNGEEAIEVIKQSEIDLVVTAIQMPITDGVSLLQIIRKNYISLPVVVLARFGNDDGVRSLEHGADDCIYLPFQEEEFKFRIARSLRFRKLTKLREMLIEQNRELWGKAITDNLTGLYNRNYFDDVFVMEFERARRYQSHLGCIIIDVDHFKNVNDLYGHLMGDQVLRELGALVKETFRKVDITARYGGEEYALLLPETVPEGIYFVCERFRKLVAEHPFASKQRGEQGPIPITISLGAAHYPDEKMFSASDMLRVADDMLYKAKREGRNRVEANWK
jgi:diguanylate cyclase (GGDEF)-like protein